MRSSPDPAPNGDLNLSMVTDSAAGGKSREPGIESENQALREEVARLQQELAENQQMLDQVLADYIHSQYALDQKNLLLAEKDEQISVLRKNQTFPTEGPGPETEPGPGSGIEGPRAQQRDQREAAMALEIDRLEAELAEERRVLAETREKCVSAETRLEEEKQRCASLESQLQSDERMRCEMNDKEAKVKELQDLVHFFKRNSERNSKRVTELTEKLEALTGAEF